MAVARTPSGVFAMLTFASVGLVLIFLAAPGKPATSRVAQIAAIPLTDDDGDQALFAAAELAPGHPKSRCLQVRYNGAAFPGDVELLAEDVSGALASRLEVTVERGTGGDFASCVGFSGSVVYDGLLADLAAGPADVGVPTGWVPAAVDTRTYRITVDVLSGTAAGQTSTATFRWLVVPGPTPAPSSPAPSSPAPSSPAPSSPAPSSPAPEPSSATPQPTSPAPKQTPPAPKPTVSKPAESLAPPVPPASPSSSPPAGSQAHGPTGTGTTPPGSHPRRKSGSNGILGALPPVIGRTIEVTTELAARTTRHSGVLLASIAAVILFMLAQNNIDKRDPKLALAPVTGEPYLEFGTTEEDDGGGRQ